MITQKRAKELFYYNPETGVMLMYSGQNGWYEDGYLRFTLSTVDGRKKVRAHQIAWLILHNEWTMVDHEDTNRSNIKANNLRKASKSQNAANTGIISRNTSGVKGVSFCQATKKWRASIRAKNKSINLGRYSTMEEAAAAYAQAAKHHFGEFARLA